MATTMTAFDRLHVTTDTTDVIHSKQATEPSAQGGHGGISQATSAHEMDSECRFRLYGVPPTETKLVTAQRDSEMSYTVLTALWFA